MDNRTIHYHKEIRRLFDDPSQRGVFRIDEQTVGVTDGPLSKAILAARPMYDFERIVFKPILGQPIAKATFSAVMRAVGQDARRVAESPPSPAPGWPGAGPRRLPLSATACTRRTPGPSTPSPIASPTGPAGSSRWWTACRRG